ncbi:MAG: glycogen/starch/alpha-glucan phosphorylase, partial [Christensenellales bacterium]
MKKYSKSEIRERILEKTQRFSGEKFEDASKNQIYKAMCLVVKDILTEKRVEYKKKVNAEGVKRVYYMSMEFLLGRSLKNHLFNLGIYDDAREVLRGLGVDIEELLEIEPDAGLGNGGLGRLAAAYMDSLTSEDYMATGFSIKYDYGIFKQRIVDGWQTELPDDWLTDGDVWLAPRMEDTFEVTFGGRVEERWAEDGNHVTIKDCQKVLAVPYDMHVSGYDCEAVNTLRLWSARSTMDFDMALFSKGEYVKALENKAMA